MRTAAIRRRLQEALRDSTLSPKPTQKRQGSDSWLPFYAGYSSAFVERVLNTLDLPARSTVLDPWNGAGTTTTVADRLGFEAVGVDINPITSLVASARLARAEDARHSLGLAAEMARVSAKNIAHPRSDDPLLVWLTPALVAEYRTIESAILKLLASIDGRPVRLASETAPPLAAFFISALVRASKRFVKQRPSSNPTWVRPQERGRGTRAALRGAFLDVLKSRAGDLRESRASLDAGSRVILGDSRELPLDDGSVAAVVTSPPYCTRIDYFASTAFELAALGVDARSSVNRPLRESAMGTNLVRRTRDAAPVKLPPDVESLLTTIGQHPSKASATYYLANYRQYFADAAKSLLELKRVLRPNGPAVIVVQTSFYKDVHVPLADFYVSIATAIGLDAHHVSAFPVRRVLANIHRSAARHPARAYTEDVILVVAS